MLDTRADEDVDAMTVVVNVYESEHASSSIKRENGKTVMGKLANAVAPNMVYSQRELQKPDGGPRPWRQKRYV